MEGMVRIIYAITLITALATIVSYILIANQISSPTTIYRINFIGNATLRKGDLLFTFKPTITHRLGGDVLDFRLTATNTGNLNNTFYHGDLDPTVDVYSGGIKVSTLAKARTSDATLYGPVVEPGISYTIGWTWNLDSFATSNLSPGFYNVTAKWSSGVSYVDTQGVGSMMDWETPGVPTQVYFGVQPVFELGILLTMITLILIVFLYRRIPRQVEKNT